MGGSGCIFPTKFDISTDKRATSGEIQQANALHIYKVIHIHTGTRINNTSSAYPYYAIPYHTMLTIRACRRQLTDVLNKTNCRECALNIYESIEVDTCSCWLCQIALVIVP